MTIPWNMRNYFKGERTWKSGWVGLKQQISLKGRILVRFLNVISPINEGVPLPD